MNKRIITLLIIALLITGLVILNREYDVAEQLKALLTWINQQGIWAPIIFIGTYIAATVLMIPGSLLTLGAGVVFGVAWGSLYVSIAATLGASLAFLIGRYLTRDLVEQKLGSNPNFAAVDRAVADRGWKIVLLVRLSPIFPFNVINYLFGLTKVSFWPYSLASWIGMIPGTIMFVYIGSLIGSIAQLDATREGGRSAAEWALYGVGFAATVIVTIYITRVARAALQDNLEPNNE